MALALLAYPDTEQKRRDLETRLNQETIAEVSKAANCVVPPAAEAPECAPSLSSPQLDPFSSQVRNRIDNRLRVARMFRPFVRERFQGALPAIPRGLQRYSINALSGYVSNDDKDLAQNFDKRWFKTTLPVLHLSIAFDLISTLHFGDARKVFFNVHDEEFIDSVLWTSVWLEDFVTNNTFYAVDGTRLIRLRAE